MLIFLACIVFWPKNKTKQKFALIWPLCLTEGKNQLSILEKTNSCKSGHVRLLLMSTTFLMHVLPLQFTPYKTLYRYNNSIVQSLSLWYCFPPPIRPDNCNRHGWRGVRIPSPPPPPKLRGYSAHNIGEANRDLGITERSRRFSPLRLMTSSIHRSVRPADELAPVKEHCMCTLCPQWQCH